MQLLVGLNELDRQVRLARGDSGELVVPYDVIIECGKIRARSFKVTSTESDSRLLERDQGCGTSTWIGGASLHRYRRKTYWRISSPSSSTGLRKR